MAKVLTAAAVDRLRRDGLHFPIPCISKREAADCRRRLEAFEAARTVGRSPAPTASRPTSSSSGSRTSFGHRKSSIRSRI